MFLISNFCVTDKGRSLDEGKRRPCKREVGKGIFGQSCPKCLVDNFLILLVCYMSGILYITSSQAPSYARRLQSDTIAHSLTYSLTGVKCRATSVAKNEKYNAQNDTICNINM